MSCAVDVALHGSVLFEKMSRLRGRPGEGLHPVRVRTFSIVACTVSHLHIFKVPGIVSADDLITIKQSSDVGQADPVGCLIIEKNFVPR